MAYCNAGDAKELSEMAYSIWTEYYSSFITGDNIEYILNKIQSEEAIKQQISDGSLYSFIISGGKKAGYFCIVPQGELLFISKFYLYKEFRGKRIGSETIDFILSEGRAMKKKTAYLLVNRNNLNSIAFYKRKGFVIAKEEDKHIGDGHYMKDYHMEYYF